MRFSNAAFIEPVHLQSGRDGVCRGFDNVPKQDAGAFPRTWFGAALASLAQPQLPPKLPPAGRVSGVTEQHESTQPDAAILPEDLAEVVWRAAGDSFRELAGFSVGNYKL
jgi:hypothetical protein